MSLMDELKESDPKVFEAIVPEAIIGAMRTPVSPAGKLLAVLTQRQRAKDSASSVPV